jgi:hypothetical protein
MKNEGEPPARLALPWVGALHWTLLSDRFGASELPGSSERRRATGDRYDEFQGSSLQCRGRNRKADPKPAGPAERARSGYPLFATPLLSCLFMTLQFQTKLVPAKPGCCRDSAWLRVSSEIGRQRGLSIG